MADPTLTLVEYDWPARHYHSGYSVPFSVSAGQALKIETSPAGYEILDTVCPAGKAWTVEIHVKITETTV